MVFMRDQMFSHLEGERAKVIDQRIRGLQGWIREEPLRRAWVHKKNGILLLQSIHKGNEARKIADRRRLEYKVEHDCMVGVTQRKLELLEAAVEGAIKIQHNFPMLDEGDLRCRRCRFRRDCKRE